MEERVFQNTSSQLRAGINFGIGVFFLTWFMWRFPLEFLCGLFVSLPCGWLIIFLIFRKEKRQEIDTLTVGKQLTTFTTKIFTGIRVAAFIIFVLGEFLFKQKLSMNTFMSFTASDGAQMFSLLYVVLGALVTELTFVAILFDIKELFGKENVYSDSYDPKWKNFVAYLAVAFPFIVIVVLFWISRK